MFTCSWNSEAVNRYVPMGVKEYSGLMQALRYHSSSGSKESIERLRVSWGSGLTAGKMDTQSGLIRLTSSNQTNHAAAVVD